MAMPITIPPLGWSTDESAFAGWLKREGDTIRPGDALFSLESEKATQEVEALDGGVLRILPDGPKEGDRLGVGTLIGYLAELGEALPAQGGKQKVEASATRDPAAGPAARQLARELGVELGQVAGTGKSGRVMPEDVRRHRLAPSLTLPARGKHQEGAISPRARRVAKELGVEWAQLRGSGRTGRIRERDIRAAALVRLPQAPNVSPEARKVPVTSLRKTIAARMLQSHQSTAPVTLTTSADATHLVSLRQQFKAAEASTVPSFTDFLVKLTAIALKDHPLLNSRWEGDHIVLLPRIDIGLAVDTDAGLLVPVIRDVPGSTLRALAARSRDLISQARARKLTAADIQGGTFTVTSLGAFGIDAFTPVINVPEAAILGIGRIQRVAVVRKNKIVARDSISLSLTFDHRVIDGAPAARFLQTLCKLVENPSPWLMA